MQKAIALHTPYSWLREGCIVLGASLLISLFAPLSVALPFTPVPITFQVHVVLFLAYLLGSRRATMAVFAFLLQGACGLPVFAGGMGSIAHFLRPSAGYLIGYLFGAFVTGLLSERAKERTPMRALFAMGVGNAVVYGCGLPWLSLFVGLSSTLLCGLYPFLIGDAIKLLLATQGIKHFCGKFHRYVDRRGSAL